MEHVILTMGAIGKDARPMIVRTVILVYFPIVKGEGNKKKISGQVRKSIFPTPPFWTPVPERGSPFMHDKEDGLFHSFIPCVCSTTCIMEFFISFSLPYFPERFSIFDEQAWASLSKRE
jgi:hypothetical protein